MNHLITPEPHERAAARMLELVDTMTLDEQRRYWRYIHHTGYHPGRPLPRLAIGAALLALYLIAHLFLT